MSGRPIARSAVFLGSLLLVGPLLTACATEPLTVDPPKLSLDQKTALIEERLGDWAENLEQRFPDVELPEVEQVRMITLQEWPQVTADCLTAEGFPTVVSNGGISSEVAAGQESAKAVAEYICLARFPVDPLYREPLNDSQLRYLYAYLVGELTRCLEERGQEIPDPPSEQTFIDTYGTRATWSPYTFVADADFDELERWCPQTPTGLWG